VLLAGSCWPARLVQRPHAVCCDARRDRHQAAAHALIWGSPACHLLMRVWAVRTQLSWWPALQPLAAPPAPAAGASAGMHLPGPGACSSPQSCQSPVRGEVQAGRRGPARLQVQASCKHLEHLPRLDPSATRIHLEAVALIESHRIIIGRVHMQAGVGDGTVLLARCKGQSQQL
jgi:hypothetical protein